jgi:hypothetical protein
MKRLLLCPAVLLTTALAAQAQVLPVPGGKNPDWVLLQTEWKPYDGQVMQSISLDRMPNAAAKSIISKGNHHYYWDAARQLSYEWLSNPDQVAPNSVVVVHQQTTGATFAYRKRHKISEI